MKKATKQEYSILEIKLPGNVSHTLNQVIGFLRLFLPVTLAKKLDQSSCFLSESLSET